MDELISFEWTIFYIGVLCGLFTYYLYRKYYRTLSVKYPALYNNGKKFGNNGNINEKVLWIRNVLHPTNRAVLKDAKIRILRFMILVMISITTIDWFVFWLIMMMAATQCVYYVKFLNFDGYILGQDFCNAP
jgi:hypothetical protein